MSGLQSESTLFTAAIESARVFNHVVAECATRSGLLAALDQPTTSGELISRSAVHPEKRAAFEALLDVLVDAGLVQRRRHGDANLYRRRDAVRRRRSLDGGLERYQPRYDVLAPWFGERHVDLIRSSNRALIGDDLGFFRSPSTRIRFDRGFLDAWRTNLTNPLYEFGRLIAVRELVARGRRFLDLAGGLGYGSERLAQLSPDGCDIVLVDKSAEFLAEARLVVYPAARVRFVERDLNSGLPPLAPASFDGVLFNGSFHFIADKAARLREIHRVLRPGGLLVLGHCFCESGFADEPMHRLYFSLLADPAWPISFEALRSLVADAGFAELRTFHRGSHGYLLAERLPPATTRGVAERDRGSR
jgi:SAM-dependent methyltransferase